MRHPEKRTVVDANSGAPWSEMDIRDLFYELARGRTIAETASFLCRDEDELRQKAKELGLVEQPGKRRVVLYRVISKITTCKITTTATPMAVNATAPRCSSRLTQSPPAWPHSPQLFWRRFRWPGRSPAFRIHIRFTVEGLKVISREASVTSRRRP